MHASLSTYASSRLGLGYLHSRSPTNFSCCTLLSTYASSNLALIVVFVESYQFVCVHASSRFPSLELDYFYLPSPTNSFVCTHSGTYASSSLGLAYLLLLCPTNSSESTQQNMEAPPVYHGSYKQRLLFAEDIIKYFMKKSQVKWIPGTNVNEWNDIPRRFTEAMGETASNLLGQGIPWKFGVDKNNKPMFQNGYNPKDFLQYCGFVGLHIAVEECQQGQKHVADGIVLTVAEYLGMPYMDGSFTEKGWDELEKYANDFMEFHSWNFKPSKL